ncbi:MAG: hypothetical protein HY342_13490 [Candidatus Lambdaproteobacteria bacterium]|nr:hypothetical protein [Candidatus Lambdaproteobacteria bacterium]
MRWHELDRVGGHTTKPGIAEVLPMRTSRRSFWLLLFLAFSAVTVGSEECSAFERRREQFHTEPSYLIFPLPYSIPGIGSGVVITGLLGNLLETHTDAYILVVTGDAEGLIAAVEDIHLIEKTLILNLFNQSIDRAIIQNFDKRGMDTKRDDYTLIEVSKVKTNVAQLVLSFDERRYELFAGVEAQAVKVPRVRTPEGDIIWELDPPYFSESESSSLGFTLDYTDDRQDPRVGLRWQVTRRATPRASALDPDFFVLNSSFSGYVPVGAQSTIGINYFTSDAVVLAEGVTDAGIVSAQILRCSLADPVCADLTEIFVAERKYGTATALGGEDRLRAYPQGRFVGAHTQYYSVEFRWNFSGEMTPFDYFIWKDVRTAMQAAFYFESGTVADRLVELGDAWRSTYGVGFRLLGASGYVYRADLAFGDEGIAPTIIFNYPW